MRQSGNGRHAAGYTLALTTLCVAALNAQQPRDIPMLDSLVRSFASADAVPSPITCQRPDADVDRLCRATALLVGQPVPADRAIAAATLAERAVTDRPNWAAAWFVLGESRLALARDTVVSHAGPAMIAGVSNVEGAANAFIQALQVDSALAAAADALALTPEAPGGAGQSARLKLLRQRRGLLSPRGTAGAAIVERDAGSVDSAVAMERRALASGAVDSGVVLLSLARDLYRTDQPDAGRAALLAGAAIATPAGRLAYHDEVSWVASPTELAQWDSLAPVARSAWLRRFWSRRDILEGRPDGECLRLHYQRLEYALAHFRIRLPESGRQKMLTFSVPMEYRQELDARTYALRHADECSEAARFANDALTIGAESPFRYYQPVQDLVDDRGVIWVRHGPPAETRQSASGEIVALWKYNTATGPMILAFRAAEFQGTSGPSVLVPSLLTLPPGVRNQVCELDRPLCSQLAQSGPLEPGDTTTYPPSMNVRQASDEQAEHNDSANRGLLPLRTVAQSASSVVKESCTDPMARVLEREVSAEGGLLSTATIARERARGEAAIDGATTTDTYHRDFAHAIHPDVQVYGLDHLPDGQPQLVVGFALPGNELGHASVNGPPARTVYPVQFHVTAVSDQDGKRVDLDTTRQFVSADPLHAGQFIVGMLLLPVGAGDYGVSVAMTQTDGHGAIATLSEVRAPSPSGSPSLSDLVLGSSTSGVTWNSGDATVPLNPLGAFPRGGTALTYVQASGLAPRTRYQLQYQVFGAADEPRRGARLTVRFNETASRSQVEIIRALRLNTLAPGDYRLRVVLSDSTHQSAAEARLTIAAPR